MADGIDSTVPGDLGGRVRAVVWEGTDNRVRATWRVLLAMPLLWILTGGILTGNVQLALDVIPSGDARLGGLAQSVLHAGFFLLALVIWARYLDRESLFEYGISVQAEWGRDFLVGFIAILLGFAFWIGFGSILGTMTITVSPSLPQESVLFGLVVPFVAFVLHAAVQQIVFFRVILETAAEGFYSRGLSSVHAGVAAIPVSVVLFVLMHGEVTVLRAVDLAVAGSIFALLYLHTGALALGIGTHFGGFYAGVVLSASIQTTGSLPGGLGVVNQYGFPKMVVAYVLVVAWLTWRQRTVRVRDGIAQRSNQ